jgi:hypothetical protein
MFDLIYFFAKLFSNKKAVTYLDSRARFKIRAQRGSNQLERGLELLRLAQQQ